MAQSAVSPTTPAADRPAGPHITPVPLKTTAPRAVFGGILMPVLPCFAGAEECGVPAVSVGSDA